MNSNETFFKYNRIHIIEKINSYETERFERLATDEKIGEALFQVELEMDTCASEDDQEKMSDRMYECLGKSKKVLFDGRTMAFWSNTELTRAIKT